MPYDQCPVSASLLPGTPKAAIAACGFIQRGNLGDCTSGHRSHHHLSDPHLGFDHEGLLAKIDQRHADLAPVIRIDRARRVWHRDTKLACQSTAGAHLGLKPDGHRHREPAWHQCDCPSRHLHRLADRCMQVHARCMLCLITRDNRQLAEPQKLQWNRSGRAGDRVGGGGAGGWHRCSTHSGKCIAERGVGRSQRAWRQAMDRLMVARFSSAERLPTLSPMAFAPIDDILADLRAGRMIVLVDDEQRENEGDLVCAAESITAEQINYMVRQTPGYLCVAINSEICDRLDLQPQAAQNTSLRATPMAVSVDGHPRHGVATGISASDRAKTTRIVADPDARPDDLVRPGHMVPLRARDGGVLVRTGQTEGSVDLMKLAGMHPAAVISEVCREDGEMARMPELEALCARDNLKMCSVEQIIEYRLARESLVERMHPTEGVPLDTPLGTFQLVAYQSVIDPMPHLALTVGGVGQLKGAGVCDSIDEPVLVRMHRRNLLGDIFGDAAQPTDRDLHASMKMLQDAGRGVLVYLRPEEVGDGLKARLQQIRRPIEDDANTPDLTRAEGVAGRAQPMDQRDFGTGVQILRDLGLRKLRILTNHPKTLRGLSGFGLEVVEQVPINTDS